MNLSFWAGKRVFITGHTGFKGGWMSLWLSSLGAKVGGYGLRPNTHPCLFNIASVETKVESVIGDVSDLAALSDHMTDFEPEIVIHMAAQPLVRASYHDPVGTYQTNIMGTVNVLEAVRNCGSVRAFVNVTTDKCYENKEWVWGYRETEAMGGYDPYSSSKGCSELITSAYRRSFFNSSSGVAVATARAGNVIGGGDWAEDRLIPDAVRAFSASREAMIRNPKSTRPWQHALEPIYGYLLLAERLYANGQKYAGAWNFGPRDADVMPVEHVLDYLVKNWPTEVAWATDPGDHPHEARLLKLDISKAVMELNWAPVWSLETTLDSIIEWYESWSRGEDMERVSLKQIADFENSIGGRYG